MIRGKRHYSFWDKRLVVLLIIGIILSGMTALRFNSNQNQDIQSRASLPYPYFCEDKCIGQNRCDFSSPGPSCCAALQQSGDPFACGWPDRGYCSDSECASIPAGVNRQRCGGPRHGWCDLCTQNGCPGYGGPPQATNPPQPTRPPGPTSTPRPRTTPTPVPTSPSVFIPTATPVYIPVTATAYPSEAPNITPVIIYITATPGPNQTAQPTTYYGQSLVNTPPPPTSVYNPVADTLATLQNFLSSFFFSVNPGPKPQQPSGIGQQPASISGPNIFERIIKNVSDFTKTIAP